MKEEELYNEALYKLTKMTKQKAILESKTKKADYTTKFFHNTLQCRSSRFSTPEKVSQKKKKIKMSSYLFGKQKAKSSQQDLRLSIQERFHSFEWKSSNQYKAFNTAIIFQ